MKRYFITITAALCFAGLPENAFSQNETKSSLKGDMLGFWQPVIGMEYRF